MLLPHGLLVLLVDGSRMQLLRNRGSEAHPHLEPIEADEIDNPRSHVLADKQPGRSFQSGSPTRHAYPAADLHTRREDEFGRDGLGRLTRHLHAGVTVVLVAPPHMLGVLRKSISAELEPRIVAQFDKDLTDQEPADVQAFLQAQEL